MRSFGTVQTVEILHGSPRFCERFERQNLSKGVGVASLRMNGDGSEKHGKIMCHVGRLGHKWMPAFVMTCYEIRS